MLFYCWISPIYGDYAIKQAKTEGDRGWYVYVGKSVQNFILDLACIG